MKQPASELMKKVAVKAPSKRKIERDFSPAEAKEIFGRINQAKLANEGVGSIDQLEEQAKVARRKDKIRKIKKFAKEMEVGNRDKIIIFPSYSRNKDELTWYKMGNFSALYYLYRMADRMGKTPKPQKDNDHFSKMDVIVSISDVDKFIKTAMRLNEFGRHEETLDKVHILYLKKALTDTELALLKRTEELRKEAMHNILRPKKALPEMFLTILMLGRQVLAATGSMERVFRVEVGEAVMKDVMELMNVYYYYTGNILDLDITKTELKKALFRIRAGIAILGDVDAIMPTKACAIGETIVKIEHLVSELK